jgi:hypothetical protein
VVGGVTTRGVVGVGATEGVGVGAGAGAGADPGPGPDTDCAVGDGVQFEGAETAWTATGAGEPAPAEPSPAVTATTELVGAPFVDSLAAGCAALGSTEVETSEGCSTASAVMIVQVAARLSPAASTRDAGAA